MSHNVYRGGKIHVCAAMCSTCIFRPGNLMSLEEGRVEGMVADADRDESTIICHSTLDEDQNLACRGYFDLGSSMSLRLARMMDIVEYHKPPSLRKKA